MNQDRYRDRRIGRLIRRPAPISDSLAYELVVSASNVGLYVGLDRGGKGEHLEL